MRHHLAQPVKATLSLTNACPLACVHCYSDCKQERGSDELSTAQWLRVLQDLYDCGAIALLLEGGEPLLRPDLFELLSFCKGRFLIWLRTHGLGVDRSVATRLQQSGVAAVCVDFFGSNAFDHDRGSSVSGSFEETCKGVSNLLRAGLRVVPMIILSRLTFEGLQDFVDMSFRMGCTSASILRLYPIGRARRHWQELACSLEEMKSALDAIRLPPNFKLMQSWHPRNANCCWESAAITATGRSIGCPYLREFVDHGDVLARGFMSTWQKELYQRLRAGVRGGSSYCSSCHEVEGTAGGCRSTAFAFHHDWDAPDPFCFEQNKGVDLRKLPTMPQY